MRSNEDTRIIQKLYRSLLPVQALALGLPAINTLINSFIVGNFFGENALAAIGFSSPISLFITALSEMLCSGSQMVSGRYLGKGDRMGMSSAFTTTLISCGVIGGVFTLILMLFPSAMAYLMGASGEVGVLTGEYISGYGVGVIFYLLTSCLLAFLQTEHMEKTAVACTAITLTVNIGGNLLNALFLHWGIFGVSFFMSLSSAASGLTALTAIIINGRILKFSLKTVSLKTLWQIVLIGFPSAVSNLTTMVRDRVCNHFLFSLGGNTAVAALTMANNINFALGKPLSCGNRSTTNTVASVLSGHRDASALRNLTKVVVKTTFPLYLAVYAVLLILAKPLALLLGAEKGHIDFYVTAILLFNLWYITSSFAATARNIYQAMGKVWLTSMAYIINNLVVPLFICFVLTKPFGINVLYCVPVIPEVVMIILFELYFVFRTKRMPKSPLEMVYVPDSLSAPLEDCFDTTITDMYTAVNASCELYSFCVSKGLPRRTAYASSLCVEEIAADAVKNRFKKKKSAMDLRVIYENGGLSIMMRDDCPHFDPKEWLELCSPKDEARSIGIKMAMGMAKDTNYVSTLGLNVLMIKL